MRADRSRLPDVGPDPTFTLPAIATHRLRNGLEVRTVEHHNVPVITFMLQVEGGSGADPSEKDGLAAVVADMADEGTGTLDAIDVSDALARIGAEYDVDVAADAITFSLTTLTRFADRGAALLARMAIEPSLHADDFERVRQLRLDRLKQLKDLAPAVAERTFLRLLYGLHPYGHLPLGSDRALRALSLTDVEEFHAARFAPQRATLIVAGAMTHDDLLRVATDAFGGWDGEASASPGPSAEQLAPFGGADPGITIVPRERAAQSEMRIGHLSIGRNTPDYHALLVMNSVLGGQFVSRVNLKLREEKGFTYGARTGFDWRRGPSPFTLQASVHTASTAEAVRDSLDELMAISGSRPPTDNELSLAKASLTRGYPRNFETAQQVARAATQLVMYRLPDTYFRDFIPTVNAVTGLDVTRVAARYLEPNRMTILIVGDRPAIDESMRALDLGEPSVVAPEL